MDLDIVTAILQGWQGSFDEESIQASVFTHAHLKFYKSLFFQYADTEERRLELSDGYAFFDLWQRLVAEVKEQGEDSHF